MRKPFHSSETAPTKEKYTQAKRHNFLTHNIDDYCELCDDCYCEEEHSESEWEEAILEFPDKEIRLKEIRLDDVLKAIPAGIKMSQVKLDYSRHSSHDELVWFYEDKPVFDKKSYQKAEQEYQKWEAEMAVFNEWLKAEEIKNLEAKLKELKKKS